MLLLPEDTWEIQTTPRKGRGIFAKKLILPGTVIGDYLGLVINNLTDNTREKDGLYLMYYHNHASIYPINVQAPGIHLLNHSCMPNCWLYTFKGHTLFFTLRTIFPGEELTADYLLSPADYCKPCLHGCRCGMFLCRGTMHLSEEHFQQWDTFHEAQVKETKRVPIRYGKLLKQLKDYPKTIPDRSIYNLFGTTTQGPLRRDDAVLPSVSEIRKTIRKTGRMQAFPKLHIIVLGIQNNTVATISPDAFRL